MLSTSALGFGTTMLASAMVALVAPSLPAPRMTVMTLTAFLVASWLRLKQVSALVARTTGALAATTAAAAVSLGYTPLACLLAAVWLAAVGREASVRKPFQAASVTRCRFTLHNGSHFS